MRKAEFIVDICMISISLSPFSLYPVQHIHVCLCSRHCPNTKDTCFAWICAGYSCTRTLKAAVKLPPYPFRALCLKIVTVFINVSNLKRASINGNSPNVTAAGQLTTFAFLMMSSSIPNSITRTKLLVALETCIMSNPNYPVLLDSTYIGNTSTRVRLLYGRNEL